MLLYYSRCIIDVASSGVAVLWEINCNEYTKASPIIDESKRPPPLLVVEPFVGIVSVSLSLILINIAAKNKHIAYIAMIPFNRIEFHRSNILCNRLTLFATSICFFVLCCKYVFILYARNVTLAFNASPKLLYTGDLASPSNRTTSLDVERNKLTTKHNEIITGISATVNHGTFGGYF